MLVHWACAKISASLQQLDDQLKDVLACAVIKQQEHMLCNITVDYGSQSIFCAGTGALGLCPKQRLAATP